jgi:hypothetical protein
MGALIERRTTAAPTVEAGDVRATPESSVVTVRLPFGAFVWNRPSSIVVEREGRVERLPIVDVTRIAQLALWACVLVAFVACRLWPGRRKEH